MEERLIELIKMVFRAVQAVCAVLDMFAELVVQAAHLYGVERWGAGSYGVGFADGACMALATGGLAFRALQMLSYLFMLISPVRIAETTPLAFVLRLVWELCLNAFWLYLFWQMVSRLWGLTTF